MTPFGAAVPLGASPPASEAMNTISSLASRVVSVSAPVNVLASVYTSTGTFLAVEWYTRPRSIVLRSSTWTGICCQPPVVDRKATMSPGGTPMRRVALAPLRTTGSLGRSSELVAGSHAASARASSPAPPRAATPRTRFLRCTAMAKCPICRVRALVYSGTASGSRDRVMPGPVISVMRSSTSSSSSLSALLITACRSYQQVM